MTRIRPGERSRRKIRLTLSAVNRVILWPSSLRFCSAFKHITNNSFFAVDKMTIVSREVDPRTTAGHFTIGCSGDRYIPQQL